MGNICFDSTKGSALLFLFYDITLLYLQLRRKSKAQEAGLQEGDVLLTINGYSCKNMTHATAMTLVDTSGQQLTMTVLRQVFQLTSLFLIRNWSFVCEGQWSWCENKSSSSINIFDGLIEKWRRDVASRAGT